MRLLTYLAASLFVSAAMLLPEDASRR